MSQLYTYDDAFSDVFGGGEKPDQGWDSAFNDVYGPKYVAGGPGGIPGAKEGLPAQPTQQDPWSMGAPVFDAPESKFDSQTIRAMIAFKQNVKAMGGDIDGKSDAEVFGLMQRFNQTGGNEITANEQTATPGDEFWRGLRRGVAYGLPAGLPGVEAMRESEQVQRAPEGFAGFAGQTLGGFAGLLDPGKAPENFAAIAFTGGAGRMLAGPVEAVGKRVAQSLGAEAGARAVNMIREAVENAGQGGGIAALNEIGQIPADDWTNKPGESVWRVVKAAGVGAAAGGTLGAGFGAARKQVLVPKATLPERVFSGMLDADTAQAAQEGRQAMQDVRGAYGAAPRAGEMDPAVLAASRLAELRAMEQARAAAATIESTPEPAREPTPVMEIPNGKEGQGQGRQEGLLSQEQPAPEAKAPAVDSLSYTDLRKRAAALGVLKSGPQNKAALVERVTAAEAGSQAEVSPRVDTASTSEAAQASEGPAPTREVPQTESSRQALDRAASPNSTRQPWEMTRDEFSLLTKTRPVRGRQISFNDWASSRGIDTKNLASESDVANFVGQSVFPQARSRAKRGKEESIARRVQQRRVLEAEYEREVPEVDLGTRTIEQNSGSDAAFVRSRHRRAVAIALSEGRAVPPEVLADYPDLAASANFPKKSETPNWLEQDRPELESRYRLPSPIVGKTGAKIVGYQWMSQMEEGMFRDRRVSDWSRKTTSEPTGRDIVHVYWVQTPDGETKVMGVGAAQKALGMSESKLQTIAKREQQNQRIRVQQWDTSERNHFRRAATTIDDANAMFRNANNPDKMFWGTRSQHIARAEESYAKSTILTKEGRFLRMGRDQEVIDNLVARGWTKVDSKPPTPAESGTTPAGTAAARVEAPKASAKPTDYPGTAQGTAQKEGIAGTAAKEAPEQPVPSTPTTSATAEPAVEPPASSPKTSSSGNAPEPTAQSAPESPRPERPASKDRQTSDDFTARRVVNKPEPGEPEGPVTAAKNEMTSAMREALNLQAFDSPERRTWQATLDTAVARGIPAKSLDIAAEVNLKPRVLAPEEEAGMTYRLVELSNEKRDIAGKLDGAKTDADRVALLASDERATQEIDAITTALNKGGTEAGRALNIRRMLLKDDYSLARVKLQIKKAEMAGAKFSPEQVKELESLAVRIEKASKDLESIAQKSLDQQAENTIKRHAASKRGLPAADRERVITELADSVRTLLSQGCR